MAGRKAKIDKTFRCDLCGEVKPFKERGFRFSTGQKTCQACRDKKR